MYMYVYVSSEKVITLRVNQGGLGLLTHTYVAWPA